MREGLWAKASRKWREWNGVKPEGTDHMGVTPFMRLCAGDDVEAVRAAVQSQLGLREANTRSSVGQTPLSFACERSSSEKNEAIVRLLLTVADPMGGRTPALILAAGHNNERAVRVLSAECDLKKNQLGAQAANAAAGARWGADKAAALRELLAWHDPKHRDGWGLTALGRAIIQGNAETARILAPISDWRLADDQGITPLERAAVAEQPGVFDPVWAAAQKDATPEEIKKAMAFALRCWAARPAHDAKRDEMMRSAKKLAAANPDAAVELAQEKSLLIRGRRGEVLRQLDPFEAWAKQAQARARERDALNAAAEAGLAACASSQSSSAEAIFSMSLPMEAAALASASGSEQLADEGARRRASVRPKKRL
jgi:hypothetical protein